MHLFKKEFKKPALHLFINIDKAVFPNAYSTPGPRYLLLLRPQPIFKKNSGIVKCFFHFIVFISMITNAPFAQDHPIEKHIFEKITQLEFTKQGKPVVFTKNGDHLVHVLNQDTYDIEASFVQKGNGPGELQMVKAAFLDQKNDRVYLAGMDKRVLGYTLAGELIFEKAFDDMPLSVAHHKTPSLMVRNGYLFASESQLLNLSELPQDPISVVKMLDTTTTELVYEFTLTMQQLAFPNLHELRKTNTVPIHPMLTFINDRLSVVTINGLPYFYFFVNGEFRQRTEIDTDYQVEFTTATREEFGDRIGVRTPSNINNIQRMVDNKLLISYGNTHQDIPIGYSIYEIEHNPKPGLQDEISVLKISGNTLEKMEDMSEMNITWHEGGLFIHNNYDWLAHQIYVIRDINFK